MDDEEQFAILWRPEREHNPFADATNAGDGLADNRLERRIDGAEHERTAHHDAVEWMTDDARVQRLQVDDDVGQFGHSDYSPAS